ncbi:MAG: flagellar biosynthesis protein FliQ [Lachnospiraceae bacterium]|nr:flagellar biosynthesis protein FliQ [Lachnospiraceae bacterium]MBQ4069118.1 flagellar biosynthesis protein FliQ [Lachnospiraceae bacterium]
MKGVFFLTQQEVLNITSETIWLIIKTAGPLLIISLIVGLIVSVFQTVTSIQEQTLTFVPKIVSIFLGIMLLGSYILTSIVEFMESLWGSFGEFIL